MTSSRRRVGVDWQPPTIRHRPVGAVSSDAAEASIDLAEHVGLTLDHGQREVLRGWLAERRDGSWAAFECCLVGPRQTTGKNHVLQARQLAGLFIFGEELQLHTAHQFKTANEHFLRMAALVQGSSELRRKVARIRWANGEQGIELKSGARLKFAARSNGSGRGFAGVSTVVYDEAMFLEAEHVGASLPTLATNWNPQVVYAASAGLAQSSQLRALRGRALGSDGSRLAFDEWTAEFDADGNCRHRDDVDIADRALWLQANPSLGQPGRVTFEFVEAEMRAMSRDEFLRERLGFWDPEPLVAHRRVIPEDVWLSNVTDAEAGRPAGFGIDVSPDRSVACIAAASADGHVGVVEHQPGVGWLRERVAELRVAVPDAAWVIDGRSAANGVIDDVEILDARGMAAACGALFDAVVEHRVRYRRQSVLEDAVSAATQRSLGDAWAWDRRSASGDITALVAVTLAFEASRRVKSERLLVFAW